jgi:hypothetical protein
MFRHVRSRDLYSTILNDHQNTSVIALASLLL